MNRNGTGVNAIWTLALVILAGGVALVFLPPTAFKDVTQELIALFGLMMAGVLPTMVLTASALRAGNLSVKKLQSYLDALRRQLLIWIGLFLIALVASVIVIIGKMVDWSAVVSFEVNWNGNLAVTFDLVRILNAFLTMALTLIVFRAIAVGNGLISLLRLSGEIAISEAQARDEARHRAAEAAVAAIPPREGYGNYVELKH